MPPIDNAKCKQKIQSSGGMFWSVVYCPTRFEKTEEGNQMDPFLPEPWTRPFEIKDVIITPGSDSWKALHALTQDWYFVPLFVFTFLSIS